MPQIKIDKELDLVFERTTDLPPEVIWKAWTNPDVLKKWFCPKPWSISDCEIDLKPGGAFNTTMKSPEGQTFPNNGCILEVVENKKLVWTDALLAGYRPSPNSMMTGTLYLEPHGTGTKYTAVAAHRNVEDRKKHEAMGFNEGWGKAFDQMVELMKK